MQSTAFLEFAQLLKFQNGNFNRDLRTLENLVRDNMENVISFFDAITYDQKGEMLKELEINIR